MRFYEREGTIEDLVRGKRVLHLGCIGFADSSPDERNELFRQSLHFRLSSIADVLGVDYAEDVVTKLHAADLGKNILVGNVEQLDDLEIPGTFDVVLAGDIIEHIDNPGLMLAGIKKYCTPDTELIVTTPNAFGILGNIRYAFGRFREAKEHVLSFNPYNLEQLLERHGFRITAMDTCYQHWVNDEHHKMTLALAKSIFRVVPRWGGTLFVRAQLSK